MSDDTLPSLPGNSEVSLFVVLPDGVNLRALIGDLREGRITSLDLPLMDRSPAWGLRIIPRFPASKSTMWSRTDGVVLEIPDATCYLLDEDLRQYSPFWLCAGSINTQVTVKEFTVGRFQVSPMEDSNEHSTQE